MATTSPSISQDASSLRVAALMTLKSKIKSRYHPPSQPDDTSSLASTRKAPPSPELNYGSDDGMADADESIEGDERGEGEKEEGEISEDDTSAAVKTSPTLMDIDDEPLPGLTAPLTNVQDSEDTGALIHRSHKSPPADLVPPVLKTPTLSTSDNSNSAISGPGSSSVIVLNRPSTQSALKSVTTGAVSPTNPATEAGSRSSNRSPANNLPTPFPRPSSGASKPSVSFTSDSTSRFIPPRLPQRDTDRRVTDPVANTERPKAKRYTPPPVFSRQPSSKPSLLPVDNAHVRPSLSMTSEEFIEAKSIILDLLGWGVPSEYFINCGLTREAIFYAFTEMNLKLPNNLNTHGIVPYGPPADYVPESTLSAPEHKSPVLVEPESSVDPRRPSDQHPKSSFSSSKPTDRRAPLTVQINTGPVKLGIPSIGPPHPLPPRPKSVKSPPASPGAFGNNSTTSQGHANGRVNASGTGPASNPSASLATDSMPGIQGQFPVTSRTPLPSKPTKTTSYSLKDAPTHGYSGNLDEIETLRRQELLARKAVLASRKPKLGIGINISKPSSTPGPSSLSGQDPRITSHTLVAKSPPRRSSDQKAPVPVEAVDDFLKSITSGPSTDRINGENASGHPLTRSPESMDMDIDSNLHEGPISGGSRGAPLDHTSFAYSSSSMDSQSTSGQQPLLPSRRSSMKRPVASDFVDFDPTSYESSFTTTVAPNGGPNGRSRGTSSSTPSFASLASTRKVVIDFSDTEDEQDQDGVNAQQEDGHCPLPHPRLVPIGSASLSTNPSNAPTPEPVPPAPPASVTPEALILKEQEIRKMKEMIAERERNRLKKLANQPKNVTPPPPPPSLKQNVSVPSEAGTTEVVIRESPVSDRDDVTVAPMAGDVIYEDAAIHHIFPGDVLNPDLSTTSTPPSTDTSAPETQDVAMGEQGNIDGRSWAGTSGKRRSGFTALMRSTIMVDLEKSPSRDRQQLQDLQSHLQESESENEANNSQVMSRLFSRYKSPLSPFASFRSATHLDSFSTVDTFLSSTLTSSLPLLSLDTPVSQQLSTLLRPLKEGTLLKLDPKRAICQFEIPGAGKCRDATCSNVHLRAFDPNDDETARYLAKALPAPQPTAQAVKAALTRVRASQQELDLDNRISQTLLQLGVW